VTPLVVVDADVLGRRRTGDETYVRNLLRELAPMTDEAGIRLAAVTRDPALVPSGVEALALGTSSQELRMILSLPRLLGRVGASLCHTQYAVPLRSPCPCVLTVHDLSFVQEPALMGRRDRLVFRTIVPRAVRRAARVLTVSERTKRDLVELYRAPAEKIVVTPNGVDPAFSPSPARQPRDNLSQTPDASASAVEEPRDNLSQGSYALTVGAIQRRKNQLAALEAAQAAGLRLVVAGPEKDAALAAELRRAGARIEGYVETERLAGLYRRAACLVQASRYEGFGLPVLEAMASGTPVVAVHEPALEEVAGDAALFVEEADLAAGIRRAVADRDRFAAAGLERARAFSWRATAARTLAVYREILDA
jgi:glycosyltransferase involved in cell wall biosynthesis